MKVSSVGEFGLIHRLDAVLGRPDAPRLVVGTGDDAAVWSPTPGTLTVATTDALVEGVHFDLATTGWSDLGWKALAESISDIAAMGCWPRYALVALGSPADRLVGELEALYQGLRECAVAFGCSIVGGDVVRAPCVVLQVTVLGESLPTATDPKGRPLLERSTARAGDILAVTGRLGGSAAGLRLLTAGAERQGGTDSAGVEALIRVHRRPMPRISAGIALVEAGIRCAIDISDGLVADVGHLCEASAVDAEVDASRVPLHSEAVARFGPWALEMALTGGEDYELACAGAPAAIDRANEQLLKRGEPPLVVIGSIVPEAGPRPTVRVRRPDGGDISGDGGGYEHFSAAADPQVPPFHVKHRTPRARPR